MRRIRADPPAQALVDDGAGGDWTTSPPVTTTLRSSRPELAPTPSTPDRCGLGRRPSARADTKNSGGTNPTRSSLVAGARQDPIWRPRPRAPGPPRRPILTGTGRRREPASNAAQGGAAGRGGRAEQPAGRQAVAPKTEAGRAGRIPPRCPQLLPAALAFERAIVGRAPRSVIGDWMGWISCGPGGERSTPRPSSAAHRSEAGRPA